MRRFGAETFDQVQQAARPQVVAQDVQMRGIDVGQIGLFRVVGNRTRRLGPVQKRVDLRGHDRLGEHAVDLGPAVDILHRARAVGRDQIDRRLSRGAPVLADAAGGFDTVQPGHRQVHQDQVEFGSASLRRSRPAPTRHG